MGLGGEGEGTLALEGRIASIPVLLKGWGIGGGVGRDVEGIGVEDRAWIAKST